MSTVIYFHEVCLDGFACALTAYLKFRDTATYIGIDYDSNIDWDQKDNTIYFIDLVPNTTTEIITKLCDNNAVTIIDHHDDCFSYPHLHALTYIDLNRSACTLAWEFFFPTKPIPKLFEYIEEDDIELNPVYETRAVCFNLTRFAKSFNTWLEIVRLFDNAKQEAAFLRDSYYLYDRNIKLCKDIIDQTKTKIVINDRVGIAMNVNNFAHSDVTLLTYKDYDFSMVYCICSTGRVHVTLRSERINVRSIAKEYHGGGVPDLASFNMSAQKFFQTFTFEELSK